MDENSGTYILILENDRTRELRIGKLGNTNFARGFYLYVGSAFGSGGVRARVNRHFRDTKKPHWHIDALTCAMETSECWYYHSGNKLECVWNSLLADMHDDYPLAGFGSTDCGCLSHLHFFSSMPELAEFSRKTALNIESTRL